MSVVKESLKWGRMALSNDPEASQPKSGTRYEKAGEKSEARAHPFCKRRRKGWAPGGL